MPTEAEILQYADELGLSDATKNALLSELRTNQTAANQFVGQRLRHADYTKKTTALATERQQLEENANKAISTYAQQLADAEGRISSIMKDFETESISRTTAETRLRAVKEKYNLSNDDIPAVTTPAAARKEDPPQIDIDKKLKSFGEQLMSDIRREMSAVPNLNAIQFDMVRRHKALTGNDLTAKEISELNSEAMKNSRNLLSLWEEKYEIGKLEREVEYKSRLAADRQKWEDEQKAARSEAAMSQATSSSTDPRFTAQSSVLTRQYEKRDGSPSTFTDPASQSTADKSPAPGTHTHTPAALKLSGAERAAAKWIDRAASGQIGKPVAA